MNKVSFGYRAIVDVGASTKEGSFKMSVLAKDGSAIKIEPQILNPGARKYKDNDDFLNTLAQKINVSLDEDTFTKLREIDPSDDSMDGLCLLMPASVSPQKIGSRFVKFHDGSGPLTKVDFSDMKDRLRQSGVKIADKFDLRAFRDITGALVAVVNKIKSTMNPGLFYTVLVTGGGAASGNIKVLNQKQALIETYGSHLLLGKDSVQRFGDLGGTATDIVCNVCKGLDIEDRKIIAPLASYGAVKEIVSGQDLTLSYPLQEKNRELAEALVSTGLYSYESQAGSAEEIKLKFNTKENEKLNKAVKYAIDRYADSIAILAIAKTNEFANGLILTGPIAMGFNKICKERYNTTLPDLIEARISEVINSGGSKGNSIGYFMKTYGFKVICDEQYAIKDNTECGNTIFQTDFVDESRDNWLMVDLNNN